MGKRSGEIAMTYKAKEYYQDKAVADRYYKKRFRNIPGIINHFLEKSFLVNVVKRLQIASALDVACGTGRLTKELLSLEIPVVNGADISQDMLNNAKRYCGTGTKTLLFQVEDATKLSFENKSYDLVISFRFLDHLPEVEKKKALSEMIRCSKKYLVFSMANKNRWTKIAYRIRRLLNKNYYEGYLIDESSLLKFLESYNVKIVSRRLKFPFLSMEIMYFCEV